jgi:predicted transcriptional regulator
MEYFGYTYWAAKTRLRRLKKQGLIANFGRGQYTFTDEGHRRLRYYGR